MRIEFNGAVFDMPGFDGAFSLSVDGKSISFVPGFIASVHPKAPEEKAKNTFTYMLRFFGFERRDNGPSAHNKIPVVKCVRDHLGVGIGEAKAIVEGQVIYVSGPEWASSIFQRELYNLTKNYIAKKDNLPSDGRMAALYV